MKTFDSSQVLVSAGGRPCVPASEFLTFQWEPPAEDGKPNTLLELSCVCTHGIVVTVTQGGREFKGRALLFGTRLVMSIGDAVVVQPMTERGADRLRTHCPALAAVTIGATS